MILKQILILMVVVLSVHCSSNPISQKPVLHQDKYFQKMEGCFLLYNLNTKTFDYVLGEPNCRIQYSASSTFKVPLAVMAFDSGILKDENQILKWNGKKEEREVANKDHTPKTWMSDSIVWFSQRLTPKLGKEKFQNYLNAFEYGNRNIEGGIQKAWLLSSSDKQPALKISAYEQIEFLRKLWKNELPASVRSMQMARDLTYLETSSKGYKLHGKTGSNFFDSDKKVRLGWFISHIEKDDQEFLAVTNFRDLGPTDSKNYGGLQAKEITKSILTDINLW